MSSRKSQIPYFLGVLLVVLLIGMAVAKLDLSRAVVWIVGLLLGFTLQRSRFCLTATFRDITLFGSTSAFRGLLILLAVSTVGFFVIQKQVLQGQGVLPGTIDPVGWHTILGGLLFGIGMVLAGGCASGTLMRMGEGYLMQWLVFVNLIIGLILGAYSMKWWAASQGPVLHLPSLVGWWPALMLQLAIMAGLYYYARWWENR